MSDKQAALVLLQTCIAQAPADKEMMAAWRRGEADAIARFQRESFRDLPSFGERLISARNRAWIPKIEGYIRERHTYFVVAGAAHLGGRDGLLAILRSRNYRIEQL